MKSAQYYFIVGNPSETYCHDQWSLPASYTCNKVGAIKAYRLLTGEGLKEAKVAVEKAIAGTEWVEIFIDSNHLADKETTEEDAVKTLRREGFDVVSVSDLLERLTGNKQHKSSSLQESIRAAAIQALELGDDHTALRLIETLHAPKVNSNP